MKIINWIITIIFVICSKVGYAAVIDTLSLNSKIMNRNVEVIVIVPDKAKDIKCPVIYLLHGYSDNARKWLTVKPSLPEKCDIDGVIVVCPDAGNSWYWDSPKVKGSCYETFVTKELIEYIDDNYNTIKDRNNRAISGLSMGGHGSLWLSFRNKELFGAVGSTSGGVDIRPFPENWEIKKLLGDYNLNKELWNSYSVINQVDKIKNGDLAIIFDCGTEDVFYNVNVALHNKFLEKNISHDFISRAGGHNNTYWRNSIDYQWIFFMKFFNKM